MLQSSRRSLTPAERRVLRAKSESWRARGRRASSRSLVIAGGVIFALWLCTILASDAPWLVVTAFWLVVGGAIAVWVRRDARAHERQLQRMSRGLESALRRNAADVYDVRARSFAELEEIEDEGACYAFELGDDRLVFIAGQQFYPSARFPSLDFSLVYVLDQADHTVDMVIEKRGTRAAPARRIPAVIKETLEVPQHLEVRTGTIAALEDILRPQ
jgi:hypothetical protein